MKQAEKVCFTYAGAFNNEPLEELCERLCRITPAGLDHAFVVPGGSEATEAAIKMARQYHLETGSPGKFKIIGRWQGFHGNTIAALSVTGRTSWRNYFAPYLLNFPHIHPPNCYRCPYGKEYPGCDLGCAWELERTINQEGAESVAAFIAEPISGTSITASAPPQEYWPIVREICDRHNVLLIIDEVLTGVGRTGKNFGCDHYGLVPDLMTTAKGMSSGYTALGAVVCHDRVYEGFAQGTGRLMHSHTFAGNPLAAAVGAAVLKYIEDHDLVARSAEVGEKLLERLTGLARLASVGDVRGKGCLLGLEFVRDKGTKEPHDPEELFTERLVARCLDKGVMLMGGVRGTLDGVRGDHLQISPPFIISDEDVNQIVDVIGESLEEMEQGKA